MPTRSVILAALAVALVACSGAVPGATPAAGDTTSALPVRVTTATYGTLAVTTTAGATCSASIHVTPGDYGEAPPASLAPVAATTGSARWTYPAPRVPNGPAAYDVTCSLDGRSGSASGPFDVSRPAMVATGISVHVTTATPPRPSFTPDASLVPLRDSAASRMTATLSDEWKTATRGLGSLSVVPFSADITIFVVAAKGLSVNRTSLRDMSEDIVIYVDDVNLGIETPENLVATALHEIGHIWCCHGPDADGGGHWKEKVRDPGLYGVDKYGLMTDPVTCETFGAILSCPNRFSDREMRALGFTSFPPPAPDPCVQESLALRAQVASMDAELTQLRAEIEAMPPSAARNAKIVQYNTLLEQRNALAVKVNALPCDVS